MKNTENKPFLPRYLETNAACHTEKILLVVDMQNDFIDGSLGSGQAQAIVPNVAAKVKWYFEHDYMVIFTRDTHGADYLQSQEGKYLPVEHCIKDTHGWEISDNLNTERAVIWDKPTFGSPELAEQISMLMNTQGSIKEIEIVGLCTDICVVSNALILKAFLPEVKITVDSSCCAGVTVETHKAALETMKMCQVNII